MHPAWPTGRLEVRKQSVSLWWTMSAAGRLHAYGITPQSGRTRGVLIGDVRPTFQVLDLSLLRDLQRVIDLDPKVSNGALQLAMAEQELDGP